MNLLTAFRNPDRPVLQLEITVLFRAHKVFARRGQPNFKVAGGIGLTLVGLVGRRRRGRREGDASPGNGCAVFVDDSPRHWDLRGAGRERENKQTRYEPPPRLHGGTPTRQS